MITVLSIDPAPPEVTLFTTSVFFPRECWVSCSPIEEITFVVNDPADIPKYEAMGYKEVITKEEYNQRNLDEETEDWYDDYSYDTYSDYDEYPDEDLTP